MLNSTIQNIFTKKITIAKWQFNLILVMTFAVGSLFGVYFLATGILFPGISADTSSSIVLDTSTDFEQGVFDTTAVSGLGAGGVVHIEGEVGPDGTLYKRSLEVSNVTGQDLSNYQILIDEGGIGYWNLDETSGSGAGDISGNSNNGLDVGGSVITDGRYNKSRNFDGIDDYISIPASSSLDLPSYNAVTMSAWINVDAIDPLLGQQIIAKGTAGVNGYGLKINAATGMMNIGHHGGSNFSGTIPITPGVWHHVVGVINGADTRMYVDGQLDSATGTVNVINSAGIAEKIGASVNSGGTPQSFFNGQIDEVRVYNRALSGAEVQKLMDNNRSPLFDEIYLKTQEDGDDFRFKDSNDSTDLEYWVEKYTAVGQNAKIWVRIPSISSSGKNINMYYGSAGAVNGSTAFTLPATGGNITYSGNDAIHTFTSSGNFNINTDKPVEVLVVAGGGAGGATNVGNAGGGGAGGLVYDNNFSVSSGNYAVTVGAGGATSGANGQNSVFSTLTAVGGGRGGSYSLYGPSNGGSGGGSGQYHPSSNSLATGTSGQGNNGGGTAPNSPRYGGAGGGGVGAVGGNDYGTNSREGGFGGSGVAYSISGISTYYAGGGAGSSHGSATVGIPQGGAGGGGNGRYGATAATSGSPNTGGGGGGGGENVASGTGGSGIVIIRYPYVFKTVSLSPEESTLPLLGMWESPTNDNIIDLIWNGGWGDGTDGSVAFSATVNNVGAESTITFQIKSAQTKEDLATAPYADLGVANGGVTFEKTKAELDLAGVGTGNNRYVQIKATLEQDSGINPELETIVLNYRSDDTPPSNATNLGMALSSSGRMLAQNDWANNLAPYFSWSIGNDNGQSGILGYCAYLGTDETIVGDPETTPGLLGTSPIAMPDYCPFIIPGNSVDFANATLRGNLWLTTQNEDTPYYFKLKAVDLAGNISDTSIDFSFLFDNTPPNNVVYLSCASGSFSNVVDMNFMWPTSGNGMASDDHSGLFGYQYQLNSIDSDWLGSTTETILGINQYFPLIENSRNLTSDQDGGGIVSGNNIVYFRAIDNAGNVSGLNTVRTCNLAYGGDAPRFNDIDVVTVSPQTSTENSFALEWPEAQPSEGQSVSHYYYMVNTPTPSSLNTLENNPATYFDNGTSRQVSLRNLPNVNKGTNTVTVVAVDDAETPNYSPSNSISGNFILDSTDPDNVNNLMASDSSIKSLAQWNVTLTWGAPEYQGAGNLHYLISRSENGIDFEEVGETSGLSYVDNTPESKEYFYKVFVRDGANAESSGTNAVSIFPTGKWVVAPELDSEPIADEITTKKALVSWSTKRAADSKIQIGTKSGTYEKVEPSDSAQATSHSIRLSGLEPDTKYFYKAKWTDEDGNTGVSTEKTFRTEDPPSVKNVSVKNIGISSAIVSFTTKGATKVRIDYGQTTNFGGSKEISTSTSESTYATELSDLLDGTKYYYRINTFDAEESEYEGTTIDFTTLPKPRISNVEIEAIKDSAQPGIKVTWNTNTEISSIISYAPNDNPTDNRVEVQVDLVSGFHEATIMNLRPMTTYQLTVKGVDRVGNEASSDTYSFTTASDTRPPQISEIVVEGASTKNQADKLSQFAVAWNTDEASTSQVEFGEGVGTSYTQKTQEDSNLTNNHLVIISGLTPSKVYHLRIISKDQMGNIANSQDTVSITPKAVDSALELVVGNLVEVFGFLSAFNR
ncbi:MAG: hypothetical protein ACD_8C00080G0006 [uncultured bacterium]|nr:MAG: hypothetical protein ACD_8C00080G0006 [uncultured bacterium]